MLNQESRKSSLTMKSMKLGTKESRFTTEVTEDTEKKNTGTDLTQRREGAKKQIVSG